MADASAQAWATLRGYQDPGRYLAPLGEVPYGEGERHALLAAPASIGADADGDLVQAYLRHSCDLTMRGGAGAAVTYPLAACALAEHHVVRRVGGSGAAAAVAAAVAAAELGRSTGDGPGTALVAPGYAGLAEAVGWLAGDTGGDTESRDDATDDATDDAGPRDAGAVDAGRADLRFARLLPPAPRMRGPYRLVCALLRPGGRSRVPGVLAALAGGASPAGRVAVALVWAGVVLGWLGLTVALLRSPTVAPWVVAVATPALLATVVLAGLAATVLAGALGLRDTLEQHAADEQFGLVPGVPVVGPRGGISRLLDRLAGVPDPAGLPPLVTWLADLLDDLAGAEPAGPGLLEDAGVDLPADHQGRRRCLTFGDLWLGRPERRDGDAELLRRAASDAEHRVVDLRLVATDVTRGLPVRLPLTGTWLFCATCLRGTVPERAVDQLVAAAPPAALRCPTHGESLAGFPDAAEVPVVVAVRLALGPAGLLRAVPLHRPSGPDAVTTHWFTGAGDDADVAMFDAVLPRWPTFGLSVQGGAAPRDDDEGPWVDVAASDAMQRPAGGPVLAGPWDLARALLATRSGARDRAATEGQGERGRVGVVRRGRGAGLLPDGDEVLRLALRGAHAGRELSALATGPDGDVAGQTGTDRYRWVRLRTALREQRRVSLGVAAGLPLFGDLAATYRVPAELTGWFTPPLEPGRIDPAWADAAAALAHLRSLAAGGVLDWDTDYGAPPKE